MRKPWLLALLMVKSFFYFAQDSSSVCLYPTAILTFFPNDPLIGKAVLPFAIYGLSATYKKVYAELRYNYDQAQTMGVYAGFSQSFSTHKMEHVIIPQFGVLLGDYTGGSMQLYYLGTNQRFDVSILSQVSQPVSPHSTFYYNWSGLDFVVWKRLRCGASVQFYSDLQTSNQTLDGALTLSFKSKKNTLQLYYFNFYRAEGQFMSVFFQRTITLR